MDPLNNFLKKIILCKIATIVGFIAELEELTADFLLTGCSYTCVLMLISLWLIAILTLAVQTQKLAWAESV